jgi:hypothetical protein
MIKSSSDSSDIRTPNVRSRIGARAMQYLRNAIEIARHEGSEKHEKDKTMDKSKHSDIAQSSRNGRKRKTNESMTFKDFLMIETTIDVDLTDQRGSTQDLRRAQRLNKSNPDRINRETMVKAKQEQRDAQQSAGDDPTAHLRAKVAKKKVELSIADKRLNSAKKQQSNQQEPGGEV